MTAAVSTLLLVLGIALGAIAVWLLLRTKLSAIEIRCATAEKDCAVAQSRLSDQDEQHRASVLAVAEQLKNELQQASNRLAQQNREEFLELASQRFSAAEERSNAKLSELVVPVSQKLTEFDTLVKDIEKQRIGAYEGLTEQIKALTVHGGKLQDAAIQLSTQTSVLVSALRNPSTRGKWGEVQLRRVVELAGMEPHCDFTEQQTFNSVDGQSRPDLTVKLPGDAVIFVDAKVPLNAYLDAIEIVDEAIRRDKLRAHAAAMKSHVDNLARKNYARGEGSADFVVMFVPGEAFLSAACIENPDLIEYAAVKGIYISSPLTLIALLRSYALGWQQRRQEENAKQIAELGRELYDRVRIFAQHFAGIGGSLSRAVASYNSAVGSLESRVLPQGRRLKEVASLADAEIPEVPTIELAPRDITALDAAPATERRPRQARLKFPDADSA
ncbi:MAG: DNA recombination protein RmuC [Vulcanimicrobiaceae bacterium]